VGGDSADKGRDKTEFNKRYPRRQRHRIQQVVGFRLLILLLLLRPIDINMDITKNQIYDATNTKHYLVTRKPAACDTLRLHVRRRVTTRD
jgi:hypothetical protein